MKRLEDIILQESVYLNDWAAEGKFGVVADFEEIYIKKKEYLAEDSPWHNESLWRESVKKMDKALAKWKDIHILFATYSYQNYEGDAWVLFHKDGKLYEVSAGHCSCYGLEGQWSPEEVMLEELKHRLTKGKFGRYNPDYTFHKELVNFLGLRS